MANKRTDFLCYDDDQIFIERTMQEHLLRNKHQPAGTISLSPSFTISPTTANDWREANHQPNLSRRPSALLQDILVSGRRPSAVMTTVRTQQLILAHPPAITSGRHINRIPMGSLMELSPSNRSINIIQPESVDYAKEARRKNRRVGDDALSTALSALYAKFIVILGIAMPVTEILTSKIPSNVYYGFYVYLYLVSIAFVIFAYVCHARSKAFTTLIKRYNDKNNHFPENRRRATRFGSFYLRVGAISFAIGTMVYSGLEFGSYFERHSNAECSNILIALTPMARMALAITQMQFIFLNTTELDIARHKVVARFGLMHMVATNLCEWLYVLVEETKHEIHHFAQIHFEHFTKSTTLKFATLHGISESPVSLELPETSTIANEIINGLQQLNTTINGTMEMEAKDDPYRECARTSIMGNLVQNASPFLFPCTIEYSLICAVILYEMWKQVKSLPDIERSRRNSQKHNQKSAHHFSVDCARAHRGMFAGILVIVLTIICLIMYFVLSDEPGYKQMATYEVTVCEIVMYSVTTIAVIVAVIRMRDLKFSHNPNDPHTSSITLDCTLLIFAQTGNYVYGMFSIIGSYFSLNGQNGEEALAAELLNLLQTSCQTLFILNSCWRRCKGSQQHKRKPGREIVTFLLVANISMWFLNTMIKGRASFRPTHLDLYGIWAWTVITHVSMPLAIFYRFHSTICLFEIWKSAYKVKSHEHGV